ncbi:MAG: HEPN domain-containing protein [Candidatus Gastranaerophilales bacterium]|jgi:uncharacterized protein (UPF0332 family)|nr:HEPN domain-containing protein [Candidatus Gastranaerophilales bacterium]
MKPQHKEILIKNLIYKCDTALEDAKLALDNNRLDNAQNRIYYAIFYIVSALGYKNDFITSKHGQLMGWFNKNFIKDGIFDIKYGEIYKKTYEYRKKSDYEFTYKPVKEKVEKLFEETSEFIEIIKKEVCKTDKEF